jgi:hypothetical protein
MKIHTITEENLEIVSSICLDPSVDKETRDLMETGMDERISWIKKMMSKGLEILIVLEKPRKEEIHYKWVGKMLHSDLSVQGQVPLGLLEYIPIEHALEPVKGKKSLFINCMWILPPFWLKGAGTALVESYINNAKKYGGASVIAYDGDKWFGTSIKYMPSNFFKKFGFKEVDRHGSRVLLFLDLGSHSQPRLIMPSFNSSDNYETLTLDIYFNNQCPWSRYMINTIKKGIQIYSNIDLNIVNMDNRKLIEKFGISRGICLNGKPIFNRMASWNEIKPEIETSLKEFR